MMARPLQVQAGAGPVPARPVVGRRLLVAALPAWLAVAAMACTGVTPAGQPTPTPPSETAFGQTAPRVLTPAPNVSGDPNVGRRLLVSKGCTGCHTIGGVPGATGVAGPNLTNVALRPTIAGESIPNSPEMLVRWLLDPPAVKPGTSMPRLGLTEQEARDLVAFLESQPHNAP
jgi:cytochrome c2